MYEIILAPRVEQKIFEIQAYIAEHYSEISADRKVTEIVEGLSILEVFPEGGFNADERYGREFDSRFLTRGLTLKKDYIALYFVDEINKKVVVTHLSSTKENPIKLFK